MSMLLSTSYQFYHANCVSMLKSCSKIAKGWSNPFGFGPAYGLYCIIGNYSPTSTVKMLSII